MGDFQARVGSQPVEGVDGTFGEYTYNMNTEFSANLLISTS